jgi:hypothetical protein
MFDFFGPNASKSLKEQNEPKLYAFTAFQFALFAIIFIFPGTSRIPVSDITTAIFGAAALGGIAISSTVLTDTLPTSWKTSLSHCFVKTAQGRSLNVASEHLSGAEAKSIVEIYELPMHADVREDHIFRKLREYTGLSPSVRQSYKKYLLVREYSVIQFFLTVILSCVSFFLYGQSEYYSEYFAYMIATMFLLFITSINTERRFVEIVLKQSSLVSAGLKDAIEKREVAPRESSGR